MRKFLFGVAAASMVSACAAAQESSCDAPSQAETDALERIAAAINQADFGAWNALISEIYSSDESRADFLDIDRVETFAWSTTSDDVELVRACREPDRVVGYFSNSLTGAVDALRLTDGEGGYNRVEVRNAVEFPNAREDLDSDAERAASLDAFASRLAAAGAFSGTVLVAKDGGPVLFKSYNVPGAEGAAVVRNDGVYNLASLNKIMTATAVLQLVERGKLSLDDTLAELLSEQVESDAAGAIRVKHLLSHTSGAMSDLKDLAFEPGTEFRYSNLGFGVLGDVIANVAGMSFDDYLRLHVLGPAGMASTASYEIEDFDDAITPGFEPVAEDGVFRFVANPWLQRFPGGSVGGYHSSADDLLRFAERLRRGDLIGLDLVAEMRTARVELGAPEYGYGVLLWRGPGVWGHAGNLPGADADLEIYGDTGYVAVVLGNRSGVNAPVAAKARALFFPEAME